VKGRNGKREGREWEEEKGGWEEEGREGSPCMRSHKKLPLHRRPPDPDSAPGPRWELRSPSPHHSEEIAATVVVDHIAAGATHRATLQTQLALY